MLVSPLIEKPMVVTLLPVPTLKSLNVPTALDVRSVTESLPSTPCNSAAPVFSAAVVDRLYTLLIADTLLMVSSLAVMLAVVVGWVSV